MITVRSLQLDAYATSTKVAHLSQMKHYMNFIDSFGGLLSPLPCSNEQICAYIAFMSKTLKYSTIRQYLSNLSNFKRSMGYPSIDYSDYQIKTCLKGTLRRLGGEAKIASPILPNELVRIFSTLHDSPGHTAFRAGMLLCFRALLRKCQITSSESTIKRHNVRFTDWGLILTIVRSKSIQFKERILEIPIAALKDKKLCAVYWLSRHFSDTPSQSDSDILQLPGLASFPYKIYEETLKLQCARANLDPMKYSSHSLRRGGATFLSITGSSIEQIKNRGDWSSSCVYKYLITPLSERILSDLKVADMLTLYN